MPLAATHDRCLRSGCQLRCRSSFSVSGWRKHDNSRRAAGAFTSGPVSISCAIPQPDRLPPLTASRRLDDGGRASIQARRRFRRPGGAPGAAAISARAPDRRSTPVAITTPTISQVGWIGGLVRRRPPLWRRALVRYAVSHRVARTGAMPHRAPWRAHLWATPLQGTRWFVRPRRDYRAVRTRPMLVRAKAAHRLYRPPRGATVP